MIGSSHRLTSTVLTAISLCVPHTFPKCHSIGENDGKIVLPASDLVICEACGSTIWSSLFSSRDTTDVFAANSKLKSKEEKVSHRIDFVNVFCIDNARYDENAIVCQKEKPCIPDH